MQTLIKPSVAIHQNYTEIANLCKETGEPFILITANVLFFKNFLFQLMQIIPEHPAVASRE